MLDLNDYKIYVYILYDPIENLIKIGQTKDVAVRLSQLEKETGHQLIIMSVIEDRMPLEQILHQYFQADHYNGDWFRSSEELIAFSNSLNTNPSMLEPEEEVYTVVCPEEGCSWSSTKDSLNSAQRSLRAHVGRAHTNSLTSQEGENNV